MVTVALESVVMVYVVQQRLSFAMIADAYSIMAVGKVALIANLVGWGAKGAVVIILRFPAVIVRIGTLALAQKAAIVKGALVADSHQLIPVVIVRIGTLALAQKAAIVKGVIVAVQKSSSPILS